jgi:flagellar hook assembly protein FlgD
MTFTSTPTPNISQALSSNVVDVSKGETLWVRIKVAIPGNNIKAKIYNLSGELVRKLDYTTVVTGWDEFEWDVRNENGKLVGQGIYFVRIETDAAVVVRKVYILK